MSDGFQPAAVAGPQPDHTVVDFAPPAGEPDFKAAIEHMLAGHEMLIGLIEHLSAIIPASGIGGSVAALKARLDAARVALFPPPKP